MWGNVWGISLGNVRPSPATPNIYEHFERRKRFDSPHLQNKKVPVFIG